MICLITYMYDTGIYIPIIRLSFDHGLHLAGPSKDDLGTMLNNFNLLAVAVVIAASVKTQIYGMRKQVTAMQKNLRMCAKYTHKFMRDPVGFCCAPSEVTLARVRYWLGLAYCDTGGP